MRWEVDKKNSTHDPFIVLQMVYSRQRYIHDAGKLAVGWVWCHYPQPPKDPCEKNVLVLGVNIVIWGLRWGSPGSQMADMWHLALGEVG